MWGSLAFLVIGITGAVTVWIVFNGVNPLHSVESAARSTRCRAALISRSSLRRRSALVISAVARAVVGVEGIATRLILVPERDAPPAWWCAHPAG